MPVDPKKRSTPAWQKHEFDLQQKRGKEEHDNRMDRQRARRRADAEGINREGKHLAHTKALANGGSNAESNIKVVAPSKNLSFKRKGGKGPNAHKPVK